MARLCGVQVAKATARDWRRDRRRAPKPVLKRLRELAQIRAAECGVLCRDLDNAIARRDVEFIPAEDLWKFVNATARDQYRVMVESTGKATAHQIAGSA